LNDGDLARRVTRAAEAGRVGSFARFARTQSRQIVQTMQEKLGLLRSRQMQPLVAMPYGASATAQYDSREKVLSVVRCNT